MTEQPDPSAAPAGDAIRETGIVSVMTSTKIHQHPTAFFKTQLPLLELALDVRRMSATLAPLLGPLASGAAAPEVRYAKLLAYKQGNRGLVHYDVAGTTAGEVLRVYGKLYPELSQATRVCATMQALREESFAQTPHLGLPRALGCVEQLSMLVYIPAEGALLGDLIGSDQALHYMEQAGEWLGTLHIHPLRLERRFRLAAELVNLQAWAGLVGHRYPDLAEAAQQIAKQLQEQTSELAFERETPLHKDFHYGHIVVNGGVKVIDFDEMRLGDGNFDLAHFCANLHLQAYRVGNGPYAFSTLQSAFVRGYARTTDWRPNERFVYFYAYTCLKIAKQLCTQRGLRPRPSGEEQARQVRLMLEQGLAALPNVSRQKFSSKFATMIMDG